MVFSTVYVIIRSSILFAKKELKGSESELNKSVKFIINLFSKLNYLFTWFASLLQTTLQFNPWEWQIFEGLWPLSLQRDGNVLCTRVPQSLQDER